MAETGKPVKVAPADAEAKRLWSELGRLASQVLPKGWTLVGGLMVQLHAFEAGASGVRATTDIDILGNARVRTDFEKIARSLSDDGFKLDLPSPIDRISHRWRRGELVVDLLAPDGLRGTRQSPLGSAPSRFLAGLKRSSEQRPSKLRSGTRW